MTTLRTDSTHSGITIDYANGSGFVHGGSGLLSVYSEDEKNAIKALQNVDNDIYYLFVIDNVTRLNEDGTPMKDILAGYMPIGYQCGFLFGSPAAKYVAHELGHGAFGLHHTFSSETESFSAPQYSTDNLMDYAEGATLNHKQWTWMHENHGKGLFGFLADEEEGESVNYFGFDFYDYFFSQIGNELSAMVDAVTNSITGWFKYQKKEEKPVIPELSDNQKTIIEILTGIHDAEKNYTIKQRGSICGEKVKINGTEYKIALHILPDLKFSTLLTANNDLTLTKLAYTKDEHDDYALLHFKQSDDNDKIALTIQVEKSKADELAEYIGGCTYNPDEIVIYITRTNTGQHSTTGTLVTDDGTINGYTVELPRGTDSECKTSCKDDSKPYDCHCIIEDTYNFEINTKKYGEGDIKNTSLRIISTIKNNRIGILVHGGTDYAKGWSMGCILPMEKAPKINFSNKGTPNNSKDESISFVKRIVDWVHSRETEISMRTNKDIKSIPHKIVITKTF